jgi:hypothetical protein
MTVTDYFKFVTDFQSELSSTFSFLFFISLILLFVFRTKADKPSKLLPAYSCLDHVWFLSINNFLSEPKTGIVTGSPTLIMDQPTAGGKLDPSSRTRSSVLSSNPPRMFGMEVTWGDKSSFCQKR